MMNLTDVVLCIVCGFAVPLAAGGLLGERLWQYSGVTNAVSPRLFAFQWATAFVCGPGLLAERLVVDYGGSEVRATDILLGWAAAIGWAALYGYVLLSLFERLLLL